MDMELKGIPDGITETQVKEWVSILIERHHNAKIQQIPELVSATELAKTEIDSFRKANALQAKFEVVKEDDKEQEPR